MRFTILGSGTIALSPDRSCSGYFVQAGGARLLMDCGSGATRRLAEQGIAWQEITHVVLTHFHVDHHADLPTLLFAWRYGMLPARSAPLDIIGPAGTRDLLQRLTAAYGDWVSAPGFEVRVTEIAPGNTLGIGDARLGCCKVPHTAESVAYSITEGSRRLVYSGDTGMDRSFAEWASGCDVFVLECSLPQSMAIVEHLTPEQCGEMARVARPAHLVLTHLYPPVESVDIAGIVQRDYQGPVTIARDGWTIELQD